MKIKYEPTGIKNFHNTAGIVLLVSGKTLELGGENLYIINKRQAKRIENHFCGMKNCGCQKGGLYQLDADGTEFGIPEKFVE